MNLKYIIGIVFLLTLIGIIGCTKQSEFKDIEMTSGVTGELEIVGKPLLNQNFKVIYKISSITDASNVVAKLILPENVELVSGDLEWEGGLKEGETLELLPIEVKVTKIGQYKIGGIVIHYFSGDSTEGDSNSVYLDVSEKDASVSDEAPKNNWRSNRAFATSSYTEEINADLEFGFTELPELNKETILLMRVIPKEDISNARLTIMLHEKGLKLVKVDSVTRPTKESEFTDKSGVNLLSNKNQISWTGNLNKNEEFEIRLIVKTIATGSGNIHSTVSTYDNSQGKVEKIKISVSKYSASLDKDLIKE